MNNDHITTGSHGMSFVGRDAVMLYRNMHLRSAIKLYAKCGIIPTRGVTITRMLAMAGQVTGQKYKRSEAARAVEDLTVWIETMKSAIPVRSDNEPDWTDPCR